jgi:hypothetical protein
MRELAARPGAGRTTLRRADGADERVEMCAPWRGPVLANVSHGDRRRGGGERAGRLREPVAPPRRSPPGRCATPAPGREYLVMDSRWKPYSAQTAAVRSGKTSPDAGRRSAQRTHRRTPCLSAGETGAMSATIIGPPHASSVGIATATPPRARVGTAGAAIVLAAGPHRGGSRQPLGSRSDAACHVIGACAIDASLFGAA